MALLLADLRALANLATTRLGLARIELRLQLLLALIQAHLEEFFLLLSLLGVARLRGANA